jgi:hemoglobin
MHRTIVVIIAILLVSLIVWTLNSNQNNILTSNLSSNLSLYDRLGGVYAIAAVVNHFSDALINNSVVGVNSKNPLLRDWHRNQLSRLPGLKFMRTLWVCAISGGPFKYSPTVKGKCPFSLENAHQKLQISPYEFDAVAGELADSLDHFKVPLKEKNEVLSAFAAHKNEVNQGYFSASNLPTSEINC